MLFLGFVCTCIGSFLCVLKCYRYNKHVIEYNKEPASPVPSTRFIKPPANRCCQDYLPFNLGRHLHENKAFRQIICALKQVLYTNSTIIRHHKRRITRLKGGRDKTGCRWDAERGRLTVDFSACGPERVQQRLREEITLENKATTDNERTLNREKNGTDSQWISLLMEYVGVPCNTECEFLFLAGPIIGRTSFLSLEAFLSPKNVRI